MAEQSARSSPPFLEGGGEMGALTREHDWAATPLGPPETWPQALKTSVRLLLTSQHPMLIWWGPDLIQFYNDGYRKTMGPERHPRALGQKGVECWQEIWPIIGPQIEQVMSGRGATWHEEELVPITRHGSREDVWWTYGYSPIDDENGIGGVLVICKDVTREVLAQKAAKLERDRLRDMFNQAPGFMAMLRGPSHIFEIINESYLQVVGHRRDIVGLGVREALPEIAGQGFYELLDGVYETGVPFTGRNMPIRVQRVAGGGSELRFLDFVYQPIRAADDSVTGIFVEGYDVTERVDAGERQNLLLRELHHRVKNLFAVVSGMVSLSARTALTPKDMANTLRGRIEALARANDLIRPDLFGANAAMPDRATLDTLLDAVLLPYNEGGESTSRCIVARGPDVQVGGAAVTSLALALHETATNSAKYGALSVPGGQVRIEWAVENEDLRLQWEEIGGPSIDAAPRMTGFGSVLVMRSIVGQLNGTMHSDWRREGLVLHLTIPLQRLID